MVTIQCVEYFTQHTIHCKVPHRTFKNCPAGQTEEPFLTLKEKSAAPDWFLCRWMNSFVNKYEILQCTESSLISRLIGEKNKIIKWKKCWLGDWLAGEKHSHTWRHTCFCVESTLLEGLSDFLVCSVRAMLACFGVYFFNVDTKWVTFLNISVSVLFPKSLVCFKNKDSIL